MYISIYGSMCVCVCVFIHTNTDQVTTIGNITY